jgi:hypothetical protein
MISDKHQYIFFHTPKCGGSSIEKVLLQNETKLTDEAFEDIFWSDNLNEEIKKEFFIGKINEGQPYASHHYTTDMVKSKFPNKFKHYFKFTFARNPWDKAVSEWRYFSKIITDYNIEFKDSINSKKYWSYAYPWTEHAWEQFRFALECDFVGRFENLQEHFDIVCDKIGIPQQQLPHQNKTNHKHYTEYYDEETKQIVAEKYAKDIEYFGYKFGEI